MEKAGVIWRIVVSRANIEIRNGRELAKFPKTFAKMNISLKISQREGASVEKFDGGLGGNMDRSARFRTRCLKIRIAKCDWCGNREWRLKWAANWSVITSRGGHVINLGEMGFFERGNTSRFRGENAQFI